jgi:F0F1-type ATP synthase membrane subunit b/b'
MANMVGGPGSLDPAQREQIIKDNLKNLLGETKDLSLDDLNKMAQQKLADFDAKIEGLNAKGDEIKAKANKVTDQMRDLQNKKDAPQQNTGQGVKQKV